ncbi:MAG: hypothetical protein IKZ60_04860 [Bacteroidales bacterium]|nr:hypothetical protein [Bacteroidales bacterium]
MRRISILLSLFLCGCASEMIQTPVAFGVSRAPLEMGDASMSEFHYLTYDYSLGSWSGELGGVAALEGNASSPFFPQDASRVYWPEGKVYSFYAAGFNDAVPVPEDDVEFGISYMMYSSGTTAVLNVRNPKHNVDWLAAKALNVEKTDGIPLTFKHIGAKISRITYDIADYRSWIEERELDITDIILAECTLTDVDEQTYIYSSDAGSVFRREYYDYSSSAARSFDGPGSLHLSESGTSVEKSYYAFPGYHTLTVHVYAVDVMGNQVIDDRTICGELFLPMNKECELTIVVNPDCRDLEIRVNTSVCSWENGSIGTVSE